MEKIMFKEPLETFLNKKRIKNKLIKNINNFSRNLRVTIIVLENLYPFIISSSFVWEETPEGHKFWTEINKQWFEYYKNHIKNKVIVEQISKIEIEK